MNPLIFLHGVLSGLAVGLLLMALECPA